MGESGGRASGIRLSDAPGRGVLFAAVLGTSMVFLDGTVVNVALPQLGRDLGASLAGLQWTLNAYTLTLAALVLLGGSLGDRYGRRRVFMFGVVWFTLASALCGLAGNVPVLVAARALQGVGGALLTPGSLALIQASLHPDDRARAIGAWSGLGGVAIATGPFIGGWLIDSLSWRYIFWLNVPLAVLVIGAVLRFVPESRDADATGRFDVAGALLGAVGLAGITYALVEAPNLGWSAAVVTAGAAGVAALAAFVVAERRSRNPMLPPTLFASRQFSAVNVVTLFVYAALGGVTFFLVVQLQTVSGYSALAAGMALLPMTLLMLAFSSRAGALGQRLGPRRPLTIGPAVAALGTFALLQVGPDASYLTDVLPGVVLLGVGLTITVAPLTATVLGAAPDRYAGLASGVSNAVARTAQLLAVAALPLAAGLSGAAYADPEAFNAGFDVAVVISGALLAVGAVTAWLLVSDPAKERAREAAARAAGQPVAEASHTAPACRVHCGFEVPPQDPGVAGQETARG